MNAAAAAARMRCFWNDGFASPQTYKTYDESDPMSDAIKYLVKDSRLAAAVFFTYSFDMRAFKARFPALLKNRIPRLSCTATSASAIVFIIAASALTEIRVNGQ